MKKLLVSAVAVLLVCGISSASIFKCWLVPGTVNSSGFYSVQVWGEILPDPAIPGEDITDSGFSDFAVTIYTPGTNGATAPRTNTAGTSVITSFAGTPFVDWGTKINPSAADYEGDGDKDAVELAVGDTDGLDITIGTAGAVLIATETWKNLTGGTVTLTPYVANTSRHWLPDGMTRAVFTGYQAISTDIGGHWDPYAISLSTPNARINASARGGLTAENVSFTVVKVMGSGGMTFGNLTFPDGTVAIPGGSLPFTTTHDLAISNGGSSQTFTVTAEVGNTYGSASNSTNVTVLQAPQLVFTVNGLPFDGSPIYGHNIVTLSIEDSIGYIDNYSLIIPNGVGEVGRTWTGDSSLLYGEPVRASVSNTGAGLNTDFMSVPIIPEPATLAIILVGSLLVRRRRRLQ